jgi:hypothetical protein
MSKKKKKVKKYSQPVFLWLSGEAYERIEENWSSIYVGVSPSLEEAKEAALDSLGVEDEFFVLEVTGSPTFRYEVRYIAEPIVEDD